MSEEETKKKDMKTKRGVERCSRLYADEDTINDINNHDGYLLPKNGLKLEACFEGNVLQTSSGNLSLRVVGGSSASSMNGVSGLIVSGLLCDSNRY